MLPEPLNTIKKKPVLSLYIAGALLLVIGGWIWCVKISTNSERVFWGMINQSLSTSSVTIQADQSNGNATLHQTVQYSLGATNVSHSLTTLRQKGTTVVDELVGTPTADYTRYLSVNTNQKDKNGKPLNFSGIIGTWAKGTPGAAKGQLFSQAVLGTGLPIGGVAVPIGNLSPSARAALIKEIKNAAVYQTPYSSVKKQRVNGREQYMYDVSVQPVAYAGLMQRFARAMGLHDLDGLDPAAFKGQAALKLKMTVDVHARHLVAAQSTNADRQAYGSYDIPVNVAIPKQAISVQELQKRLGNLQ
jgi:hypothetical protein